MECVNKNIVFRSLLNNPENIEEDSKDKMVI